MPVNNIQIKPTYNLASREWNEAQQKVVESFQKTQGTADDRWLYLVAAAIVALLLLATYSVLKRR